MSGQKPTYRIVAKSKTSGTIKSLMAFWLNDNGRISGQFDREIEHIKLSDGTIIKPADAWCNFYDNTNANRPEKVEAKPEEKAAPGYTDEQDIQEIPF